MARADGRIQPGQKLTSAVSARAWNRAQDAADIILGNREQFGAGPPQSSAAPYVYVLGRNSTDALVPRWGVVGITGLELTVAGTDAAGTSQFQEMPVVTAGSPGGNHPERWGISLEPIPSSAIGRIAVAGVVQAKTRIVSTNDRFVRVLSGNTSSLVTGNTGEGLILWMEEETGDDKWALIRLGFGGDAGVVIVQFDGAWALNATKQVRFFGSDETVQAINRFASVGSASCTTRFGAITRYGAQWHLIAAQCQ